MEVEVAQPSADREVLATKSWLAYVRPVVGYGVVILVALGTIPLSPTVGTVILLFAALRLAYRIFFLRSVVIFRDDRGIWLSQGILPWSKGVTGVKWRDLDEAICATNLVSWLFKSYTLEVRHRFTKASEIRASDMKGGMLAVQGINGLHQEMVRGGALA